MKALDYALGPIFCATTGRDLAPKGSDGTGTGFVGAEVKPGVSYKDLFFLKSPVKIC